MGGSGTGLSTGGLFGSLSTFLGLAIEALKIVANAIVEICKLFGLIEDEDPEDLGDKRIQAEEAGIDRKDFSTDQEYYEKIKDFPLDSEKSKQISEQDKLAKGCELLSGMLTENFPGFPAESAFGMLTHNTEYFSTDGRSGEIAKLYEEDPEIFAKIDAFMSGKERDAEALEETLSVLVDVEKEINPDMPKNEIIDMVMDYRQNN